MSVHDPHLARSDERRTAALRGRLMHPVILRGVLSCVALAGVCNPPPTRAAAPAPDVAAATKAAAPAHRFDVEEYRVQGNTLLKPAEIEAAVYGFLGPERTAEDVEHARAALEKLYQDKGYATVSAEVPVQRVADGVVVLNVVERKVGRLRVTGSRYFLLSAVRDGAPSLAEGKIPNLNDVKRDILDLNQWPDRSVTPVLRSGRATDTVDVDLQVADHLPLHGSLELNNRQSADTKSLRVAGSLTYGNLWQRGDSATVFFETAPQRTSDALAYSASYLFHIPGTRLSLLTSYFHSGSNVNAVGGTDVIGKGDIIGTRLQVPVSVDGGNAQTFSVGADYKKFNQDLTITGAASAVPVAYTALVAGYQATWVGDRATTNATLGAAFGISRLSSNTAVFENNRAYAQPNFLDVRASVDRLQELPQGAQAFARAQGLVAPDPLIANEQFSLGGLDTVRGYQESEVLGDYGGSLQLELRSPQLADEVGGDPVNNLRLHAFYDLGGAGIHQALPEQRSGHVLSSAGAGVRARLYDHLNGEVQDAVTFNTGQTTHAGSDHILFRIFGDF